MEHSRHMAVARTLIAPQYPEWHAADAAPNDRYVAIYARISDAGEDAAKHQRAPGIERQIADCEMVAHELGAKRIRYYRDGRSAYDRTVSREAFEQMVDHVRSGEITDVIAWRVERLARQHSDFERLMDAARADYPEPVAVIHADGVDSSNEYGAHLLRTMVSFGNWESRTISKRVRRARASELADGRFSGSPPAFGHRDGTKWRDTVPEEAALVREGAARIVAGEGVRSVLRDFNSRGSRTRKGKPWQHRAWIKLITSPRMMGARMVGDTLSIGHDPSGRSWIEPILDRPTWDRLRAIFSDPERAKYAHGGTPKHLLTGLMRCGLCHRTLQAKGQSGKSHGPNYWTYGCVKDATHPDACGRIWIKGSHTDFYIEQLAKAHLRNPKVTRALALHLGERDSVDDDLAALRSERAQLEEHLLAVERAYLDGPQVLEARYHVSERAYVDWRAEKLRRLDELKRMTARTEQARTVLRALASPIEFWDQAALDARRDLLRALFPLIEVVPADAVVGGVRRRWDPRRIKVGFFE
jgi:site-specific DNA recombinase